LRIEIANETANIKAILRKEGALNAFNILALLTCAKTRDSAQRKFNLLDAYKI
jgi:hypothetical protein